MFHRLIAKVFNFFGECCNMTAKKLSIYLFTIGAVFTTTLVLLFRFYQIRYIFSVFEKYNPVPVLDIAYRITSMVFESGVAPSIEETVFFDIISVVLFGLQCVLIGLFVFKVCGLIKRKYFIINKG